MFNADEVINLVLALIAVLIIIFVFGRMQIRKAAGLFFGFVFIASGYFFTVIEGALWGDFFNVVEHACYALAGLSYAAGCWKLSRGSGEAGER